MPPRKFKNLREVKPAVPSLDPVPAYPDEVAAPVEPEVGAPYAEVPPEVTVDDAPAPMPLFGPPEVVAPVKDVPVMSENTRAEMEAGRANLKKFYRGA